MRRFLPILLCATALAALPGRLPVYSRGDLVRLTKGEMLQFQGKEIDSGAKEQDFYVLKHGPGQAAVFVEYYKKDGTLVAVTLPAASLEASPADAWTELVRGVEAFREGRPDEAKRLLTHAGQDEKWKPLVTATLLPKINSALVAAQAARVSPAARPAFISALQGLREAAEEAARLGHYSLAQPLDEAAERLGAGLGPQAPASKLDRAELEKRAITTHRALVRGRQSIGAHRLYEARKFFAEGLEAEPANPELTAIAAKVDKEIGDADGNYADAQRMKRFPPKGTLHALTAIEMGLKLCVDHPKLRELKNEMQSAFEERTSPKVTPELLTAGGSSSGSLAALTEGHKLYTTRCTECHDLELLDSRTMTGWKSIVGSMSRRAHIDEAGEAKIIDYITVAQRAVTSKE